jgi:hypothetical protein
MTVQITYKDTELIVEGNFYGGASETREHPGDGDVFETTAVYAEGNIFHLFDNKPSIKDLDRLVLETL